MNRTSHTALAALAAVAALVFTGAAAQGQAPAEGPARWDRPVLTVYVADESAWAGTDVAGALEQWSPAMPLTLTDDANADVVLTVASSRSVEGATAYRSGEGSTIASCRVEVAVRYAGADNTATLTHELGHCLGLSHNNMGEQSVMYWVEGGEHHSETVTPADLDTARNLHR